MKKDFIKKNFFILIFSITFVGFMIGMGVEKYVSYKEEQKSNANKQQESVLKAENNESTPVESTSKEGVETTENVTTTPVTVTQKETENPKNVANFTQADETYLDGALFIGDSRTDTLASYAGWDKTTFWVKTGLTIWDVLDEKIAKSEGKKVTVKKALKEKQYDKIYIMLGVNELGTGSATDFYNQYKKVIDYIKKKQPQAVIYIQSIIHVTNEKRSNSSYINNKNVNKRNEKIINLADNKQVYWLDLNEIFDKKGTGALNKKYTSDGIHIMPKYIPMWQEYLLSHVAELQ